MPPSMRMQRRVSSPAACALPTAPRSVWQSFSASILTSFSGRRFVSRYGGRIPLLPKTLDIKELLSVQGHPEGNTEAYIIIAAEPGATIRLGFSRDIDPGSFRSELLKGRQQQELLVSALGDAMSPGSLQAILGPWMAQRDMPATGVEGSLRQGLAGAESWNGVAALLNELKALYWRVLDCMNAIPVVPGQVIHNANPQRIVQGTGKGAIRRSSCVRKPGGQGDSRSGDPSSGSDVPCMG